VRRDIVARKKQQQQQEGKTVMQGGEEGTTESHTEKPGIAGQSAPDTKRVKEVRQVCGLGAVCSLCMNT